MAVELKQGDLEPTYVAECQDLNGPVDISGATRWYFMCRSAGTTDPIAVQGEAHVFVDADGVTHNTMVEYSWAPGDTDALDGDYDVEVEVYWGTRKRTFPTKGFGKVTVYTDIGDAP